MTAFHFACEYGYSEIAEMLMKKCNEFNIELKSPKNFFEFPANK